MTQSLLAALGSAQAFLLFHPGIKSCPPSPAKMVTLAISVLLLVVVILPLHCRQMTLQALSSFPPQIPPHLNLGELYTSLRHLSQ